MCENQSLIPPNDPHKWELSQMQEGFPIGIGSESAPESRNKHIRNLRSGAGCRPRQTSVKNNNDIFVRMLITSALAVAFVRRNMLVSRQ